MSGLPRHSSEIVPEAVPLLERPASHDVDLIMKVVGPCNLKCDYCYVYEMADTSWKGLPQVMSQQTIEGVAGRITEHSARHNDARVSITLHGGEPLMMGQERLAMALATLKAAAPESLTFRMQTNASLLNESFLDLLSDYEVSIGASLDGDQEANDLHRLNKGGKSTYAAAVKGIELLRDQYPHLYSGILAVIDTRNHPVDTFRHLAEFRPPTLDFLLPHGNWDAPPPGKEELKVVEAPYGYWLNMVYDEWDRQLAKGQSNVPDIRLFQSVIRLLYGEGSLTETLGSPAVCEVVVQTDGAWEQVDTLASTYDRAAFLGLRVSEHSLQEVMNHPAIAALALGGAALRKTLSLACQNCPVEVSGPCGGGFLPHRYRKENGFDNPSVYCADLFSLIIHIATRLKEREMQAKMQAYARPLLRNCITTGGQSY